jgi:hypothetical protein
MQIVAGIRADQYTYANTCIGSAIGMSPTTPEKTVDAPLDFPWKFQGGGELYMVSRCFACSNGMVSRPSSPEIEDSSAVGSAVCI